MGAIRLGSRTEDRVPLIRDFVPLAGLDQLVFGAWDPIPDTAYEAAPDQLDAGDNGRRHGAEPDGQDAQPAGGRLDGVLGCLHEISSLQDDLSVRYIESIHRNDMHGGAYGASGTEAIYADTRDQIYVCEHN
jgi:myo-inositol-1-phosphate synthase